MSIRRLEVLADGTITQCWRAGNRSLPCLSWVRIAMMHRLAGRAPGAESIATTNLKLRLAHLRIARLPAFCELPTTYSKLNDCAGLRGVVCDVRPSDRGKKRDRIKPASRRHLRHAQNRYALNRIWVPDYGGRLSRLPFFECVTGRHRSSPVVTVSRRSLVLLCDRFGLTPRSFQQAVGHSADRARFGIRRWMGGIVVVWSAW